MCGHVLCHQMFEDCGELTAAVIAFEAQLCSDFYLSIEFIDDLLSNNYKIKRNSIKTYVK